MRRTVLIVDDEESIRAAIQAGLETIGDFEVTHAHNGHTALKRLESTRPDILFVDLVLPDIDGLQLLRAVKSKPLRLRPRRIVLMTAHPDPIPADRIGEFGAHALLEKPFQLQGLADVIAG